MKSLLPEKPLLVYPSLATTLGLEEATMLTVLSDMVQFRDGTTSQGLLWHRLEQSGIHETLPFWDTLDIQRISQRLRDLGLILIRSAPYSQSQVIEFAFNHQSSVSADVSSQPMFNHRNDNPVRHTSSGASTIAANWQPDRETMIGIGQLNIPDHFARDQVPEFVRYWRENGESQRSWGSKFIQYVKRQWTFHSTRMARNNRATLLPKEWQPSQALQTQIANEGIPATFVGKVLNKFSLYHQRSGTTHLNWDMPFFSWVKEEWQKQDTPFMESKKAISMHPDWQPDRHTIDYLTGISSNIDRRFVEECIPEFIHKWTEKKAIYSEWGSVFVKHVSEQWQFVQAGVNRNPERKPISKQWRPSADCLDILQVQSGIGRQFIETEIPAFILYWTNRAEPMHSWDNIFLRHLKHQWAAAQKGQTDEKNQGYSGSTRTRDRTIAEQLNDTSWAS
ncbi:MAG: hypothetical protein ACJAUP_001290 [Cellvibrionaceae bacterium]|jgi:hypothetical protein